MKYNIPILCDAYIDLYNTCNINCNHCKFQIKRHDKIKLNDINYELYNNKKILFCYSVDPYPYGVEKNNVVRLTIKRLHEKNNSIVFLTRRAECLIKDLDIFNKEDFIGVSLSEKCDTNSSEDTIMHMYKEAKELKINTWMSLEPIYTAAYANYIIDKYYDVVDFIRIGKDDLVEYDWDKIKEKIVVKDSRKVFVK